MKIYLRIFLSELLGTFVHVYLWDGVIAQTIVGLDKKGSMSYGDFATVCFGYGSSFVIGSSLSAGVSGGHLNPAVTVGMALCKRIPPVAIVAYWAAQFTGAVFGSLAVYLLHGQSLEETEGSFGEAAFTSFPMFDFTSFEILLWDSIWSSCLFVVVFLALTDPKNEFCSQSLSSFLIGFSLTCLCMGSGIVQWTCMNPARELIPSLITHRSRPSGFPVIPFSGPFLGAAFAALIYSSCVAWFWPPKPEPTNTDDEEKVLDIQDIIEEMEIIMFPKEEEELQIPHYIPRLGKTEFHQAVHTEGLERGRRDVSSEDEDGNYQISFSEAISDENVRSHS